MRGVAIVLAAALGAGTAVAQPASDWAVKRDPFDAVTVRRYHQLLAADPYDRGALASLTKLYTASRTAAQLRAIYEGKTDWASLVVLARLTTDTDAALELWRRAAAANDKDARAELEIARLAIAHPDQQKAAWSAALARATVIDHKREALRGLAGLAVTARDVPAIDRIYNQLVQLDPKNGKLQLERGDALLGAGAADVAVLAYAAAEKLLATDPERKLYAIAQHGRALEESGYESSALTEYERVIDKAPRGYYLIKDVIGRMTALYRDRNMLYLLLDSLEKKWPESSRGYFEWSSLAELYEENYDTEAALAAYRRAVKIAPTELATQRKLVELLDAMDRRDEALHQLETVARALPGDARLHFELAERYRLARDRRSITTLQRLSRELSTNASVRKDIAAMYTKWNRPGLALQEYEAIAALEPDDDNLVVLGNEYWLTGHEDKAFATWRRVGRTAKGLARIGTVLVEHDLWEEAITAFTQAIHRDEKDPELWRARADTYETLEKWSAAYNDAVKAASLIRGRSMDEGHAIRYQLVRILGRWREYESSAGSTHLAIALDKWTAAFEAEPPDIEAGYLLAEHYGRSPSADSLETLAKLRTLVPDDRGVTLALVRAYKILKKPQEALAELRALAAKDPARASELKEQIADLVKELGPDPREARLQWEAEHIPDPEPSLYLHRHRGTFDPVPNLRVGMKLGAGGGVRGDADRGITVGLFGAARIADRLAFVTRIDYVKRAVEDMTSLDAVALSTGVSIPIVTTLKTTFAFGASHRTEIRFGDRGLPDHRWDRLGLAGDLSLEIIPRNIPLTVGTRFEQMLSDHGRGTSLMFELGVQLR